MQKESNKRLKVRYDHCPGFQFFKAQEFMDVELNLLYVTME